MADEWQGEIPVDGKPGPSFPKTFKYDWARWLFAANVGLMRHASSRQAGAQNQHGYDGKGSIVNDIFGALSEFAVSIALEEVWPAGVNTFKQADVGTDIQVRCTARPDGKLIIRPSDPDGYRYVLVIILNDREFKVCGWKWGHEGKQPQWYQTPNGRPGAYFIPQSELDIW